MPLLRVPPPAENLGEQAGTSRTSRPSRAQRTIATRLPPSEVEAVEKAAEATGHSCSEWMREAVLLHLKRPARKQQTLPDPVLLAELLGLRSLVQNLIAAASDLSQETVQGIVRHADTIKQAKAEELLRRLTDAASPETR